MGEPVIDLVVPYWGPAEYLKRTVRSVLAQEDPHWRLTVIDDAYPEEWAGAWLESLGDERIRYVRNPANSGITEVFRQAVELARHELVAVPGSDDELLPSYVGVVRESYREFPHVDIIQPGVRVIDELGNRARPLADTVKQVLLRPRVRRPRVLAGEELVTGLLHGDWLYWPSLAFRREAVQAMRFRDDLPVILDLALVVDMVCGGSELLVSPEECFAYRRHSASASSVTLLDGSRFGGERAYFDMAAGQVAALGWHRAARAARWHLTSRAHALTLLPAALRSRRGGAARMLLAHALR